MTYEVRVSIEDARVEVNYWLASEITLVIERRVTKGNEEVLCKVISLKNL